MSRTWRAKVSCILLMGLIILPPAASAQLAIAEVIRAGVKRVIRAVDLRIQRLQNQTIWLQNAQKTLENQLSKFKLDEIADWTARQREQYQTYYDGLVQVKSVIAHYERIRAVIRRQEMIVREYARVWSLLQQDQRFDALELKYMGEVYQGILRESLQNIDQITQLIQSFSLKMEDARRIELIQQAAARVEDNYYDLRMFNQQNIMLSVQRGKTQSEISMIKKIYGIQ